MAWWPLLLGIAITFAAVKTAEILPLMGADGLLRLRLLYPYALLLKQPQLGLPEQTSNNWSQIMLYAQWALYGLYITRGDEVETAVGSPPQVAAHTSTGLQRTVAAGAHVDARRKAAVATGDAKIIECPRDAWQAMPQHIPAEVKADYLRALAGAGFQHIDAVSFVSPPPCRKWPTRNES